MVIHVNEFEGLVKDYQRLVYSICFSFTRSHSDAEDLTQETFMSAYRKISTFDGNNFKAWITTIAANKCKNYLNSAHIKLNAVSDVLSETIACKADSPEEQILRQESAERLLNVCDKLKEPYRTISIKYFFEEVKLSAYAEETGAKLKTLQVQLYRAKKMLIQLLKEG